MVDPTLGRPPVGHKGRVWLLRLGCHLESMVPNRTRRTPSRELVPCLKQELVVGPTLIHAPLSGSRAPTASPGCQSNPKVCQFVILTGDARICPGQSGRTFPRGGCVPRSELDGLADRKVGQCRAVEDNGDPEHRLEGPFACLVVVDPLSDEGAGPTTQ